jgi:hypothetical protein
VQKSYIGVGHAIEGNLMSGWEAGQEMGVAPPSVRWRDLSRPAGQSRNRRLLGNRYE